jgi:rhomboid family GlyGly-CTERM serine protease
MRRGGWSLLCALMAAGALLAWPLPAGWLDWQPAAFPHAPWRALSAPFVHLSVQHLAANLAGCAVLALFGWAARLPNRAAGAWLLAWPLTQLGLLIQPGLTHFGGLSGVLHAGVAVGVVELLMRPGRERRIGAAIAAGLVFKLAMEHPLGAPTQRVEGWDIAIAPLSHLSGVVSGVLCALLFKLKR